MRKKKIVILGASSDIGLKTVKKFLDMNWIVYAHFNQNSKELKKINNPNLKIFRFNLKKIEQFKKFLKKNKFLREIDSFISLTGYLKTLSFFKINQKDLISHINVNYLANIIFIQHIVPYMKKKKIWKNSFKFKCWC